MAWRETRASWLRLVFFFLCVGLGVASIIVLRSVVQQVRATLTREARSLIGADVVIQSNRPLSRAPADRISEVLSTEEVLDSREVIDTQTMSTPLEGAGNGNV